MFHIIKPGTRYDFMGMADTFVKVSAGLFVGAILILAINGLNLGLDFKGGHEILLRFDKPVESGQVRTKLNRLFPKVDTSVQSFEVPTEPDKTFYLTRIERSEALGDKERETLRKAFVEEYIGAFDQLRYNADAGDVIKVQFVEGSTNGADLRPETLQKIAEGSAHTVRSVRQVGRPDEFQFEVQLEKKDIKVEKLKEAFKEKYRAGLKTLNMSSGGDVLKLEFVKGATRAVDISHDNLRRVVEATQHDVRVVRRVGRPEQLLFEIQLRGVDVTLVDAMKEYDPRVSAVRVEFVGPTIGRQLRDEGIVAVLYAMILILIYIAIRFDLYYSPGAILCLLHDAIITTALLSMLGQEFTLATIAGLLTLVGYSINDTIVVFDRIRETVGKAQGAGLNSVLNQAINETLGRTLMTSVTTLIACLCLMIFGWGTVLFSFGLIMTVGIIIGTYSSIYVASPTFKYLRERFAPKEGPEKRVQKQGKQTVVV